MLRPPRPHAAAPALLLAAVALSAPAASAQRSWGGSPPSTFLATFEAPPLQALEPLDVGALLAEDALRGPGEALRYGVPIELDAGLDAGAWEVLPTGDLLWRLTVQSPGALSLGFLFSEFELVPGARLFVHGPGSERFLGAFDYRNNKAGGEFATEPLAGDEATLELLVPSWVESPGRLRLAAVVHDYFGVLDKLTSSGSLGGIQAGSCETDVACPEGAVWGDQSRSVARVLNGGLLCTGAMLNNTSGDGAQLFMTASHCGSLSNAVFQFNYQKSGCGGGGASTSQSVQGAVQLAVNTSIDYRLVRLTEAVPPSYNVYLAGWDRSGVNPSKAVTIHHPQGLPKKISFENQPLGKAGTDWHVTQWDQGVTQGGSSGCPLFDPAGRFIGQLWGGQAFCGFPYNDYFGRLDAEWSGVKSHLDPLNTGLSQLDGAEAGGAPPVPCVTGIVGAGAGGANIGSLSPSSSAKIGSNFTVGISGLNGNGFVALAMSAPVPATPVLGGTLYVDAANPIVSLLSVVILGNGSITLPIPFEPSLLGFQGVVQVGKVDLTQPEFWAFTNGVTFTICN